MIELKKEEFIMLPMMAHEGQVSLDAIATEYYGKEYQGQQTGDMMSNDSYHIYDFQTEGDVAEFDPEECYKPLSRWLSLKMGDELVEYSYVLGERKKIIQYDFEIYREAPMPDYILADLILKGLLPYGKYLVEVSW